MKKEFNPLLALLTAFVLALSGCGFNERDVKSATISADGKTVYIVSTSELSFFPSAMQPPLYLDVFDLSQNKQIASHKLPSHFSQTVHLFTQGPDTLMVVSHESAPAQLAQNSVYLCKPKQPPELISKEAFYLRVPRNKPYFWHNHAVLIGKNKNDAHALMYIQEGKVSVFPLDDREEFAAGIQSISVSSHDANHKMFTIDLRLYDNQLIYISPFLTSTGVPLIEREPSRRSPKKEGIMQRFSKEYYGDNPILVVENQKDSSAKLAAFSPFGSASLRKAAHPVTSETLYRAISLRQDNSTQLLLGYAGTNPEQATVIGYIYHPESGNLTKLPTFGKFDLGELKEVGSVISSSPEQFILQVKSKKARETDALVVPLNGEAPFYASSVDFPETLKQAGRLMSNWGYLIILLPLLFPLLLYLSFRRKP
ncbi:MAG: hypothetical protein FWG75_04935 [Cystobacterineae bacterium]|nr:hypothetical protein [Cystobacterineae bacterium]